MTFAKPDCTIAWEFIITAQIIDALRRNRKPSFE
jgi:hypothetical protein